MTMADFIDGIFGIAQQILGNSFNVQQQGNAYRQNVQMMNMQNAWNEEHWHMQNRYNSPSAQVDRMIRAGFNPDLLAGQQPVSAGALSSVEAPERHAAQFVPFDPTFLLVDSQRKKLDAEAENVRADTQSKDIENTWKPLLLSADTDEKRARILQIKADVEQTVANTQNARQQYKLIAAEIGVQEATAEYQRIQNVIAEAYGMSDAAGRIQKLQSEILLNKSAAKLNKAQVRRIAQEIENFKIRYKIDEKEFQIINATAFSTIASENASNYASIKASELLSNKAEVDSHKVMIWANSLTEILGNIFGGSLNVRYSNGVRKPTK